jgi:CBS domain containing-hemolysin-like protein
MSAPMSLSIALLMLLGNAFFVGAEFAVMSARRSQIEPRAEAGSAAARTALWAMENISAMLAVAQLGITVCTLILGALAEPTIEHLLEPLFRAVHLPHGLHAPLSLAIALLVVSYLHVVIGEMVPKNLALAVPDRAALLLAPPLVFVARVLKPVVWLLRKVTELALRAARVEQRDEVSSVFTLEEIGSIVDESRREGTLTDSQNLLKATLEFSDRSAEDVMVKCHDLEILPAAATPLQVEQASARTGFSRFPVERDGAVVGYLHLKDVLSNNPATYRTPVPPRRIRSLQSLGGDDAVETVLATMQKAGAHLGRVDDENGALIGVVFLEDVIEELVGEVIDLAQERARRRQAAAQGEANTGGTSR